MTSDADFKTNSNRWHAVVKRDAQADGKFVYGVATTLIYCRPTCASRKPNRKNVRFFDHWQWAEKNGFRPCKRCNPHMKSPDNEKIEIIIRACKMIENAQVQPSLSELAQAAGLSPYHFHRSFKKMIGVTPKQYAMENRLQRMRKNLAQSPTITRAVYESGYESGSRFYETVSKALGMKPLVFKKGGKGKIIHFAVVEAYLGWVLVAATQKGICKIDLGDEPDILRNRLKSDFPQAQLKEDEPEFKAVVKAVLKFLDAPRQGLPIPLDIQGTAFQRRVWKALQTIPCGATATYGEIARQIGNPRAARAVAKACAANRIAVAIPCHRVVKSDGTPGGYRWEKRRKQVILKRES